METERARFRKSERLCSMKLTGELFEKGEKIYSPIIRVIWMPVSSAIPSPVQSVFSVSKRQFRLAVTRNLIKRRMREAFRINKNPLYDYLRSQNKYLIVAFVFTGRSVSGFPAIEKIIKEMIASIISKLKES